MKIPRISSLAFTASIAAVSALYYFAVRDAEFDPCHGIGQYDWSDGECIDSAASPSFFERRPLAFWGAVAWSIATFWILSRVGSGPFTSARKLFVAAGIAALLAPLSFSGPDLHGDLDVLVGLAFSLFAFPVGPILMLSGMYGLVDRPGIYPSDVPLGMFSLRMALAHTALVAIGYAQWFVVIPSISRARKLRAEK